MLCLFFILIQGSVVLDSVWEGSQIVTLPAWFGSSGSGVAGCVLPAALLLALLSFLVGRQVARLHLHLCGA